MVVVLKAERCEDNSPSGEIGNAGVLYEAWCGVKGSWIRQNPLKKHHL